MVNQSPVHAAHKSCGDGRQGDDGQGGPVVETDAVSFLEEHVDGGGKCHEIDDTYWQKKSQFRTD